MQIRIINYHAISNLKVQAFVDIELDGWLRFVGLNLMRDGSLRAAQLKTRSGSREGWLYFPAVVIPDDDLRELLASEILAAIHAYVATLPPDQRMRPPTVRLPRPPAVPPPGKPKTLTAPVQQVKPEKSATAKHALPPPHRLLAAKGARP
jgi:hypothetical protein